MSTHQTITGAEIGLLSYLFEAVGDLLTPEQRQELTDQLTSLRPAGVAPGDLITAELFNAMLNNINDLLARVALLEGAEGGPVIERIEPQGIEIPVGALMTIIGRNFKPGQVENIAMIDNVTISAFNLQSDTTRLVFTVPDSFAGLPRSATVKVKVGEAVSNSVMVSLAPEIVLQGGNVLIRSIGPALGTITIGGTFNLVWEVNSATRLPADYNFTPVVNNVVGATANAWTSGIQISPTGPIRLQSGVPVSVNMAVTVPAGATSANIALRAASPGGDISNTASPIAFVVNAAPELSDSRAVVSLRNLPPSFNGAVNPLARTDIGGLPGVTMTANGASELLVRLAISATDPTAAGNYKFRARVEGETGRWTLGPASPLQQPNVVAGTMPNFKFPISSAASSDTTTVSQIIVYAEKFTNMADATPVFRSLIRIPIRGA
jgi:IPT/TIG domain